MSKSYITYRKPKNITDEQWVVKFSLGSSSGKYVICQTGIDNKNNQFQRTVIETVMGISDYKFSNEISDKLKESLPSIEDIEKRINL